MKTFMQMLTSAICYAAIVVIVLGTVVMGIWIEKLLGL